MNRVEEIRLANHITRTVLAAAVCVSERLIAIIERGERIPSLPLARKIAQKLGDSIDEIFLPEECTKCTIAEKH